MEQVNGMRRVIPSIHLGNDYLQNNTYKLSHIEKISHNVNSSDKIKLKLYESSNNYHVPRFLLNYTPCMIEITNLWKVQVQQQCLNSAIKLSAGLGKNN